MVKGTSMVCGSCPGKGTFPSSCPWRATYKNQNIPLNKTRLHYCYWAEHPSKVAMTSIRGECLVWRTCFYCGSRFFCVVTCGRKAKCHEQAQTVVLLSWTLLILLDRSPSKQASVYTITQKQHDFFFSRNHKQNSLTKEPAYKDGRCSEIILPLAHTKSS